MVTSLMKVTVVATEPVEMQVRVEDEDPGVNIRGLMMLGLAVVYGEIVILCLLCVFLSQVWNEIEGAFQFSHSKRAIPNRS